MKTIRSTRSTRSSCRQVGFNLVEIVLALSIAVGVGAVSAPPLAGYLHRSKLQGASYEMSVLMRAARSIAITRGSPVVVHMGSDGGELVAFADLHGEDLAKSPDGLFNPIDGRPQRMTDYEVGRVRIPNGVAFVDHDGNQGADAVTGFNNPNPIPDKQAVFLEDGSIRSSGAFRIGDGRGNFLQIAAAPVAQARIDVQKWDGSYWLSRGQGGTSWKWK